VNGLKSFYNKTKTKMDQGVDEMRTKMNVIEQKLMQTDEQPEKKKEKEAARKKA